MKKVLNGSTSIFKALLLSAAAMGASSAYANCDGVNKCIMRNPLGAHECWIKVRVCPLSTDTLVEWAEGVTPDTVNDALKDIDPGRSLRYYGKKIGLDDLSMAKIDFESCVVSAAFTTLAGTTCAAGVAIIQEQCFADITCMASCVATGKGFQNIVNYCAGKD